MLRLMGAVLLTAGCGALGLNAVGQLDGRVRDLSGLLAGAETLRRELSWRLPALSEGLELAASETDGRPARFFRLCAQGAEHLNGRSFQQVWQEGLETCRLRLEREDEEPLKQLGSVLGRYDSDSQRQALESAAARLERQRERALEDRKRLGRVYGVLGMTGGLFLSILFF